MIDDAKLRNINDGSMQFSSMHCVCNNPTLDSISTNDPNLFGITSWCPALQT